MANEIDDDHFEYEGGMRQCIGGFGHNAIQAIIDNEGDGAQFYINELVRWCRSFNRKLKGARQLIAAAERLYELTADCASEEVQAARLDFKKERT